MVAEGHTVRKWALQLDTSTSLVSGIAHPISCGPCCSAATTFTVAVLPAGVILAGTTRIRKNLDSGDVLVGCISMMEVRLVLFFPPTRHERYEHHK